MGKKECPACKMMIDAEARVCPHCGKQFGLSWPIIIVPLSIMLLWVLGYIIGQPHSYKSVVIPSEQSAPVSRPDNEVRGSSDDEVYKVVNVCMYLQFDLTPGWVPSGTDKAAICLTNAVDQYGEKRVEKWIIKWIKNLPADHMTLFSQEEMDLINEARRQGLDVSQNVAEMLIASARVKAYEIQERNKH